MKLLAIWRIVSPGRKPGYGANCGGPDCAELKSVAEWRISLGQTEMRLASIASGKNCAVDGHAKTSSRNAFVQRRAEKRGSMLT